MGNPTATFPDTREASRRYARIFMTLTQRFVDINTFRRLTDAAKPVSEDVLKSESRTFVQQLVSGTDFNKFFIDNDGETALERLGGANGIVETITANAMATYQTSLDSTSIVFAHSALDAAISDLCWVTAFMAPGDWEKFVDKGKITLKEVRENSYGDILNEQLTKYLCQFERESLLDRINRLFMLCKPERDFEGITGFKFDKDRLERIDRLRHQIVHGGIPDGAFDMIRKDLEFMNLSGMHLWVVVNVAYGVQVDPLDLINVSGNLSKIASELGIRRNTTEHLREPPAVNE